MCTEKNRYRYDGGVSDLSVPEAAILYLVELQT